MLRVKSESSENFLGCVTWCFQIDNSALLERLSPLV